MPQQGDIWLLFVDKSENSPAAKDGQPAGNVASPDWQLVAGQKGLDLTKQLTLVKTTVKSSNNYEEFLPTNRDNSVSLDNMMESDDIGVQIMESMLDNRNSRPVQITNGTVTYTGVAFCGEFSQSFPQDNVVTLKAKLQFSGKLAKTNNAPN